ncbi:glycoside hydrolase family 3 protein [Candidatus Saccharibacteria bacterium]|nr:glycoside hydrolase family 3 protein [Candidatus Saccharibacteria bacterium]
MMMRRITIVALVIIMVTIIFFGTFKLLKQSPMGDEAGAAAETAMIDHWLEQMSVADKVGQMIIMTNNEQSVTDDFRRELLDVKPGGYILMVSNITTYAQTKQMLGELDRISRQEYGIDDLPMILAVDEEGGNVQRLLYVEDKDATNIPYMYDIGAMNDDKVAYEIGRIIGEEVRSLGLNLTFAPSVDIVVSSDNTVIGRRSFGSDKDIVSEMASRVAAGVESIGVGTAYKHFPGHGDATVDSHIELPIIDKDWDELEDMELYPFQEAIDRGAEIIMVGHIAVGDREIPASLDSKAILSMLRKRMGFNGIIITDALNMGAVTSNYTNTEMAIMAVKAGEDILLMPGNAGEAKSAIIDAITAGDISEDRINESVRRILSYKSRRLSNFIPLDENMFGSDAHKKIVQDIRDRI